MHHVPLSFIFPLLMTMLHYPGFLLQRSLFTQVNHVACGQGAQRVELLVYMRKHGGLNLQLYTRKAGMNHLQIPKN